MKTSYAHVSWKTVIDGKTTPGANFKYLMEQLLDAGFRLDIETSSGDEESFTSKKEFGEWFDAIQC